MTRLAKWMLLLYPTTWRARYGEEVDSLLDESGADARVVADLFRGGLHMRFEKWSFLRLAFVMGATGMLLAMGFAEYRTPVYTSTAIMQITPMQISEDMAQANLSTALNERVMQIQTGVLSRTSLGRLINVLGLYPGDAKAEPLEDLIERMRKDIFVRIVALPGAMGRRASAFEISFTYSDPHKAQQTVRMLMEAFDEQNIHGGSENLDVLDTASLPVNPSGPTRLWIATLGFGGGFLLAGMIAFIRASRNRRPISLLYADGNGIV